MISAEWLKHYSLELLLTLFSQCMAERARAQQLQWQMLLEGVKAVRFYLAAKVALSSDLLVFFTIISFCCCCCAPL